MGRRIERELEGGGPHWGGRWRCSHEHVALPGAEQGGRSGRSFGHSLDTGKVWFQCVFGNVLWVHRSQANFHVHPSHVHLWPGFSPAEVGERNLFFSNSKRILTIKDSKYFCAKALDNGEGSLGEDAYVCVCGLSTFADHLKLLQHC